MLLCSSWVVFVMSSLFWLLWLFFLSSFRCPFSAVFIVASSCIVMLSFWCCLSLGSSFLSSSIFACIIFYLLLFFMVLILLLLLLGILRCLLGVLGLFCCFGLFVLFV